MLRDLVPYNTAREINNSQLFSISKLTANVICKLEPYECIRDTIDSLLKGSMSDIRIRLEFECMHPCEGRLRKRYKGDPRVLFPDQNDDSDEFSEFMAILSPGVQFTSKSMENILNLMAVRRVGGLVVSADFGDQSPVLNVYTQRAINRVANSDGYYDNIAAGVNALFNLASINCRDIGVSLRSAFQQVSSAMDNSFEDYFDECHYNPFNAIGTEHNGRVAVVANEMDTINMRLINDFCYSNDLQCDFFIHQEEAVDRSQTLPENCRILTIADDAYLQVQLLKTYLVVLDHHSFYKNNSHRAFHLKTYCAAEVPVLLVEADSSLNDIVANSLASALRAQTWEKLTDPILRRLSLHSCSRESIKYHSHFSQKTATVTTIIDGDGNPNPRISIMGVTKRPDYLQHFLNQIDQQTYSNIELVLVLHGHKEKFLEVIPELSFSRPLKIHFCGPYASFGHALNTALTNSTGEYVTKMDDDDWYYPDHLYDLLIAHSCSNAVLVGKTSEFIYLSESNITVQRNVEPRSGYVKSFIAGGTLFLEKTFMESIGGWHTADKELDRLLIEDVLKTNGRIFRCNSIGYVLNRHNDNHTWEVGEEFFFKGYVSSREGLDLEFAGFDVPATTCCR